MGFFKGLSKVLGLSREMDIHDFMSAAEAEDIDVLHKAADFYVKPISLQTEADLKIVEEELKNRNIILLKITPIARNPAKLKTAVDQLRAFVSGINGDIAKIDEDKILLTPNNIKIVKRKRV